MEGQKEAGDAEAVEKFARRTVRVTSEHNDECKKLLRLMGIPYVEAPCEAEAQCAALCKAGKVYATASEDMDSITFGTPVLLRHLTFSEARKMPIHEYHYAKVVEGLGMTQYQVRACVCRQEGGGMWRARWRPRDPLRTMRRAHRQAWRECAVARPPPLPYG